MNAFERMKLIIWGLSLLSKNVSLLRKKGVLMYEWRVNDDKCGFNIRTQYF